ncbi:MAG: hypothetical protein DRJ03_27125 [Chloroflexi bacterium]|nr:MAG: hypothetical protein DRJ03_27125 [Chloroflexota bacterium]
MGKRRTRILIPYDEPQVVAKNIEWTIEKVSKDEGGYEEDTIRLIDFVIDRIGFRTISDISEGSMKQIAEIVDYQYGLLVKFEDPNAEVIEED